MPAASLHLVCPHCHAVNRLLGERLAENPSCGQCHRPLLDGQVLELGVAPPKSTSAATTFRY